MKEKRIMIRLSKENAAWLEAWRGRLDVPVSITYLSNRALSDAAEMYDTMKVTLNRKRK